MSRIVFGFVPPARALLILLAFWGFVLTPDFCAAAFPTLRAPATYSGEAKANGTTYTLELRLRTEHFFILHERATLPDGKSWQRSHSGKWRQSQGGALLQLTNRQGMLRRFNVGGGGTLYGQVGTPHAGMQYLALQADKDTPLPFTLAGELGFDKEAATLKDAASGHIFALAAHPALKDLAATAQRHFVDVEVEESTGLSKKSSGMPSLRLVQLRAATSRMPSPPPTAADLLRKAADGSLWRLEAQGHPPLQANIRMDDKGKTSMDIGARGLSLQVDCQLTEEGLHLQMQAEAAQMLEAAGFGWLRTLLEKARYWDMEGDMLVFLHEKTDEDTLFVMERAIPAQAVSMPKSGTAHGGVMPPPTTSGGSPLWTGWTRP